MRINDDSSSRAGVHRNCFPIGLIKLRLSGKKILTFFATISSILCALPLFLQWTFDDEWNYEEQDAPIYSSMVSLEFTYSLIASASISIPMIMDFILTMIYSSNDVLFTRVSTARFILLLAIFIPDICILFIAIPLQNPGILACLFGIRGVVMTYAVFGHLWEFGEPIFRCNFFVCAILLPIMSYVIRCYSVFLPQNVLLYYLHIGTNFLGLCMVAKLGFQWLKIIRCKPLSEMTVSQYSCNVFIILTTTAVTILTLMTLITGGTIDKNTSVMYLTVYTYVEAAYTVMIAVLQSRIVTQEILQIEKSELLRLNASAETLDTLADLQSSVDIAVNTLNELLDYEKLDAGLMRIEPETIKPGPLILDTIRPFKSQAERYGVNFTSDVGLEDMLVELQDIEVVDTGAGISVLHNGNIFVSSEGEGQGSTFTIQIPIIMEETKENNITAPNVDTNNHDHTNNSIANTVAEESTQRRRRNRPNEHISRVFPSSPVTVTVGLPGLSEQPFISRLISGSDTTDSEMLADVFSAQMAPTSFSGSHSHKENHAEVKLSMAFLDLDILHKVVLFAYKKLWQPVLSSCADYPSTCPIRTTDIS
eukprot:gene2326-4526_t